MMDRLWVLMVPGLLLFAAISVLAFWFQNYYAALGAYAALFAWFVFGIILIRKEILS